MRNTDRVGLAMMVGGIAILVLFVPLLLVAGWMLSNPLLWVLIPVAVWLAWKSGPKTDEPVEREPAQDPSHLPG
jgi:hypothetical protein